MRIEISIYEPQSRYVEVFFATTLYLLAPLVTRELLFSAPRWQPAKMQKVVIARDAQGRREESYMVGIAGLMPAAGIERTYPSVAAIWVSPMVRRQGVGLALLKELSCITPGKALEMDMLSNQATRLCEKAKSRGIRIRYGNTQRAWITMG